MIIKAVLYPKIKYFFRAVNALIIAFWFLGFTNSSYIVQNVSGRAFGLKVIDSTDQGILLEFISPGYQLSKIEIRGEIYQHILMPGASLANEAGMPQLPIYSALVGVPSDAQLSLSILSDEVENSAIDYRLAPSQMPRPNQEDLLPGEAIVDTRSTTQTHPIDKDFSGIYPSVIASLSGDAWLRDQRIIRLVINPFQYNSAKSSLTWHRSLRMRIEFANNSIVHPSSSSNAVNPFEQVLQASLLNYSEARSWRSFKTPQADLASHKIPQTLGSQDWISAVPTKYRISIRQDGLYRLTYENLKLAGVPVDTVNIAYLQINNQSRAVAYYFEDNDSNQIFGAGDAILFYGQKFYGDWMAQRYTNENSNWLTFSTQSADGVNTTWKPTMNATMLEKYTDENVYWLVLGTSGIQMRTSISSQNGGNEPTPEAPSIGFITYLPIVSKHSDIVPYREVEHAEQSNRWKTTLFAGEDTWFWDEIQTSSNVTRTYPITLSSPIQGNTLARFSGEIVSSTYNDFSSPDHHILVYLNDPQHRQPLLDATWDGKSRFHFDVNVMQSRLVDGQNQIDLVAIKTPNMSLDDLYVDWFQIEYDRPYLALNNQITFTNSQPSQKSYRITGFTSSRVGVFDITDPIIPLRIANYSYSAGTVRFVADQIGNTRYYVGVAEVVAPAGIIPFTPVDFSQPADYIFITHKTFQGALQPLVDYRASQGYKTLVVSVDDLYNQFNDGIYNPIAIKNFLTYTFQNWVSPPAYVLLVGDGHWNFKGYPGYDSPPIYMPPFLNWVDPWQGEVDSANLLATVVGDDPLPDVMIGRMPVNNDLELTNIVSKTISYEQSAPGDWKKHILFVADNTPDPAGDFVSQSEQIITGYIPAGYTPDRVYLDNYMDTNTCNPPPTDGIHQCPAAVQALITDLNQVGAFLVNYTGHASLNLWASEVILSNQDISSLNNNPKLPIILSMTCLDGYWIHPNLTVSSKAGPGLAEELLRAQQRGAVATFSPTGLGVGTGHDVLQRGFYSAVFQTGVTRLGEAAFAAKLALYTTGYNLDLLHTFTVFGDPALRLTNP